MAVFVDAEAKKIAIDTPPSRKAAKWLTACAIVCCVAQILWFSTKCIKQIDFDGVAYIGIARHAQQGQWRESLNAFRSPLLSWLIAAGSFGGGDFVRTGKIINIGAFAVSAVLVYVLAKKLWRSSLAAAVAMLLFVLGRGLAATSVEMITPDFLFAALTLIYFIVLLRCLEARRALDWFALGALHGLAFLAKGFALPWLAVCAVLAVILSVGSWKTKIMRVAAAALIPVVIAAGWATALHAKYGVYTTGTQFKFNLFQWTLHIAGDHPDGSYRVLRDNTTEIDRYMDEDPMPPGSWMWSYPLHMRVVVPKILAAERRIVPQVVKELIIVATPGGVLAFVAMLAMLSLRRQEFPIEWRFVIVVACGGVCLVLAYSMLVFDTRYLAPLTPLLIVVAARFLIPGGAFGHKIWQGMCLGLVVLGVMVSFVYSSSPFRLLTRDFQVACYDAGRVLKSHEVSNVVSIGSGPYPEHGVGWEAGYKASFFGDARLIAVMNMLPNAEQVKGLNSDLAETKADAILVWGRENAIEYRTLIDNLKVEFPNRTTEAIVDPVLGRCGAIVLIAH